MAKSKFLVGLIGEGIQESLSPALHEEEARCQGLTLRYRLIDIAQAAMSIGVEQLFIVDRDHARAEALARRVAGNHAGRSVASAADLASAVKRADGLIHATPMGMAAHPGLAFDPSLLRPEMWVVEIVYFPLETELLRAARARGCRTLDGGGMMVWQAVG